MDDGAGNSNDLRRVHAPGRVNLIGEHTDYTGGLVFPMAIDRGTTLTYALGGDTIELTSADAPGRVVVPVPFDDDPAGVTPHWGSYVAAMAREAASTVGLRGHLSSDIPAGAGLSSSAALECAIGLALGLDEGPVELARLARRAEHAATGVPTGIMDQLSIAAGVEGHATMIDCHTEEITTHVVPGEIDVVVRFVAHRTLEGSEYGTRVDECRRAEELVGPLRLATLDDVERIDDDLVRRRARHVVTENARVTAFATALAAGRYDEAGQLMRESHASLRDDFEVSIPAMDDAVAELDARSDVFGARMTGGGFGGCLVAICRPGAVTDGWIVVPSAGARRLD